MELDQNEFFRQATLRICGSLDTERAMVNCLEYVALFMPASIMALAIFEPKLGVLRDLSSVDRQGRRKLFPRTVLPKELIQHLENEMRNWHGVRIRNQPELDPIARILQPHVQMTGVSHLVMVLIVDEERVGSVAIIAEGRDRFTEEHAHLLSLLREPLSIAMSNALRYEEVLSLKERVDAENRELSRELRSMTGEEIIGAESGLKGVMEMVRQVAPLTSPVMLLGETGVGKEVIANAIHHLSPRRNGPFIKVNSGAIPENLVDSELFGHEKGAFTGAIAQRLGRFERADKGTIFLDEIGDLPLSAQVRLLRVLQQKEIERVGGVRTIPVDVRVIAATHRNMEELIRTEAFREDLWFRLNIFPIMIPPLRHRKEDIPALVHHFLERKSQELNIRPAPDISSATVERLKTYRWSGNVRELENRVERELIAGRGRWRNAGLTFDLSDTGRSGGGSVETEDGQPDLLTLDEAISRHIRHALEVARGKIYGPGGAAELLDVNPNTLRSRMRKLGIPSRPLPG